MADVLLAFAKGPFEAVQKLVVIKVLREHLAEESEFTDMLLDEARLAAQLNHQNIVRTYEVDAVDGQFFIAMEFLDGQPFNRVKSRARRLAPQAFTLPMSALVFRDALTGLHYAHELENFEGKRLDVVHRDISPSNIFVTYDGVVKLLDFGIAKASGRTTETKTGVVKGKMKYMPPEQVLGEPVDKRADIFAVGMLLWEAAVGRHMWKGASDAKIVKALVTGQIPASPREQNPEVPELIDAICVKALAPAREDRYESAADFADALDEYLATLPKQPTNRQLSRLLGGLFEKERNAVKQVIEQQTARAKEEPATLEPMAISKPSPRAERQARSEAETYRPPAVSAPDDESQPDVSVRSRPHRGVLPLAAALVCVLGVLVWMLVRDDGAGDAAGAPSVIRLSLAAAPKRAEASIDGGPWHATPHATEVPRDGKTHQVAFRAAGHEPRTIDVVFDVDTVVELSLSREQTAATSRDAERDEKAPKPK